MLAESTSNASVHLGAIKARLEVHRERLQLLAAVGVFPRDLGQVRVEIDLKQIADRLIVVLENENITPEIKTSILDAICPETPATNGSAPRQLPSASGAERAVDVGLVPSCSQLP